MRSWFSESEQGQPPAIEDTDQWAKPWKGSLRSVTWVICFVFRWITRYNTVRRHSRLGQLSPIDYEKTTDSLKSAA